MSRHTAPTGEVTTPMRRGQRGSGRLRASSKRPSAASLARSASYCACRSPAPAGGDRLDVELVDALRLVGAHLAVEDHVHAVLRAHRGAGQLLAEEDRPHLAVRVLEREEAVPRRRVGGLADLALDPHVGQGAVAVEQGRAPGG